MSPGKGKASDDVPNTPTDVVVTGCFQTPPCNVTASDDVGKEKASDDVPNTPTDVEVTGCFQLPPCNVLASNDVGKKSVR